MFQWIENMNMIGLMNVYVFCHAEFLSPLFFLSLIVIHRFFLLSSWNKGKPKALNFKKRKLDFSCLIMNVKSVKTSRGFVNSKFHSLLIAGSTNTFNVLDLMLMRNIRSQNFEKRFSLSSFFSPFKSLSS